MTPNVCHGCGESEVRERLKGAESHVRHLEIQLGRFQDMVSQGDLATLNDRILINKQRPISEKCKRLLTSQAKNARGLTTLSRKSNRNIRRRSNPCTGRRKHTQAPKSRGIKCTWRSKQSTACRRDGPPGEYQSPQWQASTIHRHGP